MSEQMYKYRHMTPEEQVATVNERRAKGYPLHSPPHIPASQGFRIVTGTCFEHRKVLATHERREWFQQQLLQTVAEVSTSCAAWCVLPNHYHLLVEIDDIAIFMRQLGLLHGRTSFEMNQADQTRGRKVWHRSQDRIMRSERHYFTCLNYIHNNPVKHGYVQRWQDWPHSSVHWYLEHHGRDWLVDVWREYPVLNFGETWDQ